MLQGCVAKPKSWLLVIGVLIIATGLFLAHVLPQFETALAGRDSSLMLWSFWYPVQAIRLNQDIITTNYAVFPHVHTLLFVISPLFSLLWNTLRWIGFVSPTAFNSLYGLSLFFTGLAMFAYLRYRQQPNLLAIFFALLFAFSPVLNYRLLQGRPDLMMIGWIPLGCLVWEDICLNRRKTWRLSIILVLTLLTSLQVFVWANLVWLPYFISGVVTAKPEQKRFLINTLLWQWLILLAVGMAYPLPVLLKIGAGTVPNASAIALQPNEWEVSPGFILMMALNLLLLAGSVTLKSLKKHGMWLGLGTIYLGIASLARIGWLNYWSVVLPPVDWLVPANIAFLVFIAFSFPSRWKFEQFRTPASLVTGLFLGGILSGAIALQPSPSMTVWKNSSLYTQLGREPGTYTILDVPVGVRFPITGEEYGNNSASQQYAVAHRKRTINGSYTSTGKSPIEYFEKTSLFSFLAEKYLDLTLTMSQELKSAVNDLQIGYVIVHLDQLEETQKNKILNFLNNQTTTLCKVFTDPSTIAYRTSWHPSGCRQLVE